MSQWKLIAMGPIPSHQQPAGEALFDDVVASAGGCLRQLAQQNMDVAAQPLSSSNALCSR